MALWAPVQACAAPLGPDQGWLAPGGPARQGEACLLAPPGLYDEALAPLLHAASLDSHASSTTQLFVGSFSSSGSAQSWPGGGADALAPAPATGALLAGGLAGRPLQLADAFGVAAAPSSALLALGSNGAAPGCAFTASGAGGLSARSGASGELGELVLPACHSQQAALQQLLRLDLPGGQERRDAGAGAPAASNGQHQHEESQQLLQLLQQLLAQRAGHTKPGSGSCAEAADDVAARSSADQASTTLDPVVAAPHTRQQQQPPQQQLARPSVARAQGTAPASDAATARTAEALAALLLDTLEKPGAADALAAALSRSLSLSVAGAQQQQEQQQQAAAEVPQPPPQAAAHQPAIEPQLLCLADGPAAPGLCVASVHGDSGLPIVHAWLGPVLPAASMAAGPFPGPAALALDGAATAPLPALGGAGACYTERRCSSGGLAGLPALGAAGLASLSSLGRTISNASSQADEAGPLARTHSNLSAASSSAGSSRGGRGAGGSKPPAPWGGGGGGKRRTAGMELVQQCAPRWAGSDWNPAAGVSTGLAAKKGTGAFIPPAVRDALAAGRPGAGDGA